MTSPSTHYGCDAHCPVHLQLSWSEGLRSHLFLRETHMELWETALHLCSSIHHKDLFEVEVHP